MRASGALHLDEGDPLTTVVDCNRRDLRWWAAVTIDHQYGIHSTSPVALRDLAAALVVAADRLDERIGEAAA